MTGRLKRVASSTAQPSASKAQAELLPADAVELVGRLIGDAREDAGLPQSVAAKVLDVPQSRIAKIELGRRQLMFLEAVALAELYQVSLDRFDPRRHSPRPRDGRRPRIDLARGGVAGEGRAREPGRMMTKGQRSIRA